MGLGGFDVLGSGAGLEQGQRGLFFGQLLFALGKLRFGFQRAQRLAGAAFRQRLLILGA
jgi:hypothetical protein